MNTLSRIDFVGLHRSFDDDAAQICAALDMRLKKMPHVNSSGAYISRGDLSKDFLDVVTSANKLDIQIYEMEIERRARHDGKSTKA